MERLTVTTEELQYIECFRKDLISGLKLETSTRYTATLLGHQKTLEEANKWLNIHGPNKIVDEYA